MARAYPNSPHPAANSWLVELHIVGLIHRDWSPCQLRRGHTVRSSSTSGIRLLWLVTSMNAGYRTEARDPLIATLRLFAVELKAHFPTVIVVLTRNFEQHYIQLLLGAQCLRQRCNLTLHRLASIQMPPSTRADSYSIPALD